MQVCTSLQTDNYVSTPPLSFYGPDALPVAQPTASKHWRQRMNINGDLRVENAPDRLLVNLMWTWKWSSCDCSVVISLPCVDCWMRWCVIVGGWQRWSGSCSDGAGAEPGEKFDGRTLDAWQWIVGNNAEYEASSSCRHCSTKNQRFERVWWWCWIWTYTTEIMQNVRTLLCLGYISQLVDTVVGHFCITFLSFAIYTVLCL